MPRSIFNATVTFGLVSVPVKMYSATESKTVHFAEVHITDGAQVEHRRIDPKTDNEVDYDHVVKGYEVARDEFIVLTKDEVKAAAGERTREIPIEDFVDATAIDPVFYDRTYYLGAGEKAEEAYGVLRKALEDTGRAGIGRMTFHNKEYLVAIRALDSGVLALHTMRFADEVVPGGDVEIDTPGKKPAKREVEMAEKLVDSLHGPFRPKQYKDTYRERVLEMIEAKAAGREFEGGSDEPSGGGDELMAALQASLTGGK